MARRLPIVVFGPLALLLSSCFGSLSIGANLKVEPHLLAPGNTATIALTIEGDGLLGNAVHQQLTPTAFEASQTGNAKWDVRDNSDSQRVRVIATSTADFPGTFDASKLPGTNAQGIEITANDYLIVRTYSLVVTLPAGQSTGTAGSDQFSQQAAAAALAAVRYQWSAALPGSVNSTNGLRSDDGRIVWNINMNASTAQTLTADSTYVDVPRIVVILGTSAVVVVAIAMLRRRRVVAARPAPAPESVPPQ